MGGRLGRAEVEVTAATLPPLDPPKLPPFAGVGRTLVPLATPPNNLSRTNRCWPERSIGGGGCWTALTGAAAVAAAAAAAAAGGAGEGEMGAAVDEVTSSPPLPPPPPPPDGGIDEGDLAEDIE